MSIVDKLQKQSLEKCNFSNQNAMLLIVIKFERSFISYGANCQPHVKRTIWFCLGGGIEPEGVVLYEHLWDPS